MIIATPPKRLRVLALVVAVMFGALTPQFAAAQEKPTPEELAQARELYRTGTDAYEKTKFELAVRAFDQGYALVPRVEFRFNAAKALMLQFAHTDNLALLETARDYFEQYLRERPTGKGRLEAVTALKDIKMTLAASTPTAEDATAPSAPAPTPVAPPAAAPKEGWLSIRSPTPEATVALDGGPAQPLPFSDRASPGLHTVMVTGVGYEPFRTEVDVKAGRVEVVPAPPLVEIPAELAIHADGDATVVLDGQVRGQAPMSPISLASGSHRIAVGRTGYYAYRERFDLDRAEHRTLNVELEMTTQRVAAWTMFGFAGVSAVAAGVVAGVATAHQASALDIDGIKTGRNKRALTADELSRYNDHVTTRDTLVQIAGATFALAALSGGVGLLTFQLDSPQLYTTVPDDDTAPQDTAPTAPPSPLDETLEIRGGIAPIDGGAALMVVGRF